MDHGLFDIYVNNSENFLMSATYDMQSKALSCDIKNQNLKPFTLY